MPSGLTDHQDLAAKFAFMTYIGEQLTSPQPLIAEQELELFRGALDNQQLSDWEVVWGPALYRLPVSISHLYDNFVVVARNGSHYMVAIRGTNGHAPLDWVFEDFWLFPEESWQRFAGIDDTGGLNPKMTHGTHLGVSKLLFNPARPGVPGEGKTLVEWFGDELGGGSDGVSVTITGHSLGGALSPTVALYLKDTQGRDGGWDPAGAAHVTCVALAGPTPGNRDFGEYLTRRFDGDAARVVNPLDIVPMAWAGLGDIAGAYEGIEHPVRPSEVQRIAIDGVRDLLRLRHAHFGQWEPEVQLGHLSDHAAPSFMAQAGWQHVYGYENQLGFPGLRDQLEKEVYAPWCAAHHGACPA